MSLNIKNAETERLAKALADETGESITAAVTVAVNERLARLRTDAVVAQRRARIDDIRADAGPRWREPWRTGDHGDLLYDDAGLPG